MKKRTQCIWGDFSLVQATINSIKKIIYDKGNITYIAGNAILL
jgi:competence transcription factor ComK